MLPIREWALERGWEWDRISADANQDKIKYLVGTGKTEWEAAKKYIHGF
jgi:hypothetical protein